MPNGETWIGTRGKGIYGAKGLDFKDRNVFCMASDAKHRMWIGTFGKGLSLVYPRKDGYGVKTFFADSVGLNEVRCMVIDKHGVLWCGTSGGLIRIPVDDFVKDASRYKTYVRDYEIRDVIVDRQGRLWLSASGDGLVQVCLLYTSDAADE